MKKTLVALAVLAASGASFAQATITGTYAFGYESKSGNAQAASSGLGTDTADINFAASEDLGGGMSASAKLGISGAARGSAVTGNTATVGIKTSSFTLSAGQVESTNGLLAIGSSGAAGYGLDGKVIGGSANIDIVSLSFPVSSAVTIGANYVDRGDASSADVGLGKGTGGVPSGQPSYGLALTYRAGAVAARADYTSWTMQDELSSAGSLMRNKSRVRLSGAYDMGVARLSAGYLQFERTTSITTKETLLGVKVPFGAVTIGLDYAIGQVTNQNDTTGYSLGVGYDLSKRTNVGFSVANFLQRNTNNTAATENTNLFRVLLAHSF